METLSRITLNPDIMGGKPCIRGMRVTVGMLVGLAASGHSVENSLHNVPLVSILVLRAILECCKGN